MSAALESLLARRRLLPVLTVSGAADGKRLAESLAAGGLPLAEVTLRLDGALDAMAAMAASGTVSVGAGTVLSADQVDSVVAAGACFVVSPGLDLGVVGRCQDLGVPVLPGVATPSEAMRALQAGLRTVKLFPADLLGGPAAVRALAAPFPGLGFVPTGGVRPDHVPTYLAHPAVLAVGGSWLGPPDLVATGAWEEITRRTSEAVRLVGESRKEHP